MYHFKQGCWDQLQQDAKLIRTQVFIVEQHIPEAEEWDDHDAISQHFVIYDQDHPIATARLLQNHSVGRVAVVKAYRGRGIGPVLLVGTGYDRGLLPVGGRRRKSGRPGIRLL